LHQVGIVNVELVAFPKLKQAIGQIAFNEDASTVVQTPFSGRVTRVLTKIDPAYRGALKKAGYLTRDARAKERKKYGQRGARARFQFSKR